MLAPAGTQLGDKVGNLFVHCPILTIYSPSASLAAYAKQNFLRCKPDEYAALSALYDAAEQ